MSGNDVSASKEKAHQQKVLDVTLYTLLVEKEEEYFNILVTNLTAPLYTFLWNMVNEEHRHKEIIEDMVQDGFIRFLAKTRNWKKSSEIPPSINHYAYLCEIVRNVYFDKYRKNKKLPTVSLDEPKESVESSGREKKTIDVSDEIHDEVWVELKLFLNEIGDKIKVLNDPYRTVMLLIKDEGLNKEEIAQRLRRKPDTVKSWIRRAREQLNEMLSEPPSTDKPDEPKKDVRKKKNQEKKKRKGKEDK